MRQWRACPGPGFGQRPDWRPAAKEQITSAERCEKGVASDNRAKKYNAPKLSACRSQLQPKTPNPVVYWLSISKTFVNDFLYFTHKKLFLGHRQLIKKGYPTPEGSLLLLALKIASNLMPRQVARHILAFDTPKSDEAQEHTAPPTGTRRLRLHF
jgi:hypothetical protein